MKTIIVLGTNELRIFFRDRMALVWLIAMPCLFIWMMGLPDFSGNNTPGNTVPSVLIENLDTGFMGRAFVAELSRGVRVIAPENKSQAQYTVRIPTDFTSRVLEKKPSKVEFSRVKEADNSQPDLMKFRLLQTVFMVNARLVEHAISAGSTTPPSEESFRAILERENHVLLDARYAGRRPVPVHFNQSLPGTLVMYLLINLVVLGSTRTAHEREQGVLRRISLHAVRRHELVLGKILGLVLLSLVPITVLLTLGQFLFKVNIAANAGWIVFTLLIFSWVSASLGLLVGFLVKAPEKIVALSILLALPMAALGGCWWPLDVVPEWLQTAAHLVPVSWTLDALHQFITFGGGIEAAAQAIGVVVLFGLAANLAAMKFYRV